MPLKKSLFSWTLIASLLAAGIALSAQSATLSRDDTVAFFLRRVLQPEMVCDDPDFPIKLDSAALCKPRLQEVHRVCPARVQARFPADVPEHQHGTMQQTFFACFVDILLTGRVREKSPGLLSEDKPS